MKKFIKCEICGKSDWKLIETYKYEKKQIDVKKISFFKKIFKYLNLIRRIFIFAKPRTYEINTSKRNKYQLSRLEVLFDVWFKDVEKVIIKSQYCRKCGFALYTPRPSNIDMEAKYHYLINNAFDYKIEYSDNKKPKITSLDSLRSNIIFKKCLPYFKKKKLEVLDYGGGSGSNLINFIKNGSNCFLVDFDKNNLNGAINIGSDINQIDCNQKFDLIICSHVLEHISDLKTIINKLKFHLKEKGIIYAEVPLEIKAGISLEYDPVTHINFFTKNSLKNLFLSNGFNILANKDEILPYSYSFLHASWIIVQNTKKQSFPLLKSDIIKNLYPSRFKLLNIYLKICLKNIL